MVIQQLIFIYQTRPYVFNLCNNSNNRCHNAPNCSIIAALNLFWQIIPQFLLTSSALWEKKLGITGSLQTFWGFQSLLQNYKDNKAPRDKNSYIEMRRPTLPMPCQAVWCALYKQSGGGDGDSAAGEGGWEVLGMINNYQKDLLKERVTQK